MQAFIDLGLDNFIIEALKEKGFEQPTPIQEQVIPVLLQKSRNVLGQAQTGTGKTAAFGLPIIQNLEDDYRSVQAIILTPTRELAVQVADEMESFKGSKKLRITTVYGGQPIDRQIRQLQKGTHIVVGTPGRVIDLIKRKKLVLDDIEYFVLDEADEMLNMGFIDDIEFILNTTNEDKQVLLFSATMPKKIVKLAEKYMGDYDAIRVEKQQVTTENTEQLFYPVYAKDKMKILERILDINPNFYGIVFCNTRMGTDDVTRKLNSLGFAAEALHGDVQQNQRERILQRFKDKKCTILCATDVAARGIDVNELTHVINYQLPQDPEAYVHRIGRTGRAGNQGTAISLIAAGERRQMQIIQNISKVQMKQAELPSAKELMKTKISNMIEDIIKQNVDESDSNINKLALQLIEKEDEISIVPKILKYFLKDELQSKKYDDIKLPKSLSKDKNKDVRLFVAKGKKDRMNNNDLINFICKKSGIPNDVFLDVFILEEFSFVTLDENSANIVLDAFKKVKNNGKKLITQAKKRDGGSGNKRNGGGRRDRFKSKNGKPKKRKLRNARY